MNTTREQRKQAFDIVSNDASEYASGGLPEERAESEWALDVVQKALDDIEEAEREVERLKKGIQGLIDTYSFSDVHAEGMVASNLAALLLNDGGRHGDE